MNLSKKWLSDYVNVDGISDRDFAEEVTISGSKVESYCHEGEILKNIVTGRIVSKEQHPDADRLCVCQVNVGQDEDIQIVTNATYLEPGNFVPVALHGAILASGDKIKKGKIRGVKSAGMFCGLEEIGITAGDFPYADPERVFVLGDDCKKEEGIDIREAIGFNDTVTEFEITSNRPDCLSVIGLAREVAATFNRPLNIKEPVYTPGTDEKTEDKITVTIESDKCMRYTAAVVKNVKIEPSPLYIRERLRASGIRPINNIVDITNYVMLEYGQPMHAFDIRHVEGGQIVVREAKKNESITTLEGEEHNLDEGMLIIADEKKPIAVAGIMGGEYSGIMEDTDTIVFECASFDGSSVRRTSKELGLRTDSSARFEKGLNPDDVDTCLKRAVSLTAELGAGSPLTGIIDVYPSPREKVTLPFMPEWTNKFIGINCSKEEQKEILEKIGFTVENDIITVPAFRIDIEHQADISEEIARFYGYNNIPNKALSGAAKASLTPRQQYDRLIENTAISAGLSEIQTFSFMSPKAYDKICLPSDSILRKNIVISNPLGEDTSVMRTTAIPSMLNTLSRNYNNRNKKAWLYELATVYIPHETLEELPDENKELVIGLYGGDADYFTLKGMVEKILEVSGIYDYDVDPVTDSPVFHPGRTAEISKNGVSYGYLGEIHPNVLNNYEIGCRAYVAVLNGEALFKDANLERVYTPLPKFPATTRDLAFVVNRDLPVLKLEKAMKNVLKKKNLEALELFDVYEGEQIENSKKSVAFNLRFRSADHTLTDEECDSAIKKAIKAAEELGAELRS